MRKRMGGMLRTARAYYAVVPLAIPLVVASVNYSAERAPIPELPPVVPIRYDLAEVPPPPLPQHVTYVAIERGDTLDTIFTAGGLNAPDAAKLASQFAGVIDARRLRPGDLVRFAYDEATALQSVSMKVTGWGSVEAVLEEGGFRVAAAQAPERREEKLVSMSIDSSLYEAITLADENPQLVPELVDVFQWDVDFFRLQPGDAFTALVEKKFVGDDFVGYEPITAARFHHDGRVIEAFRFTKADGSSGYYARDGKPLRKQFLKSPMKFSRITSGFTHRRFHPVLRSFRPHPGIDYGAPVGTPVMVTADGVVSFAGRGRGEGNYIKVKHNSKMTSCYLHLSRFAKGLKRGTRVHQGDIIGYVGATGLATGPHLDYRVSDGGRWVNPLHLKSLTADPLRGKDLAEFRRSAAILASALDNPRVLVAQE
ncbi:MAG: peptidoglycan DD-metalloendopeptidase family protein [Thermoanaerobaculia bacterium]